MKDTENKPDARVGDYDPNVHAVVGASVTIGVSTEFAREKVEVSCWESRPAADNPSDRSRVKAEIKDELRRDAAELLDCNIRDFFPEMLEEK